MGLIVHIYANPLGDCSNGGVSSRVKRLTLVNVDGPFDPSPGAPAARLVKRPNVGNIVAIPDEVADKWTMSGGCFVYTSDDRFSQAVAELSGYAFGFPVALFDRVEG
jgi:hypothetical protein